MEIVNGSQKYLTATPSWSVTAGSESRELDGMLLKSEQINSTAYKLVVNVTRELFNGSNLSVICYLILNDEQYSKDESVPVILSPLEQPKAPKSLEVVTVTDSSAYLKWNHDPLCFRSCGIHFNLTLYKVANETQEWWSTINVDTSYYIYTNLSSKSTYQVVVYAACSHSSAAVSAPSEITFRTAADPAVTPTVDMPNLLAEYPTNVVIIAGTVASAVILVVLIGVLCVLTLYICRVRRLQGKQDLDSSAQQAANDYAEKEHPVGPSPAKDRDNMYANVEPILPNIRMQDNPSYIALTDLKISLTSYENVALTATN